MPQGKSKGYGVSVAVDVGIVLLLIVVEGLFVGAEISLVSLRESQVSALAQRGRRGQRVQRLVSDPNRFLASVQLGVTLTALLSSAFGAVTLSEAAKGGLISAGLPRGLAGPVGFLGVTLLITFVTLVVGELAPKRIALQRAEGTAQAVAPFLDGLARLSRPVIWLLSKSTDVVVRLLGGDPEARREQITQDELRGLVASNETLSADERRLIGEVFAAGERQLREVMVPRTEVEFLDASTAVSRAAKAVIGSPHSRWPVVRASQDDVVGFVHVRDLVGAVAGGTAAGLRVGDLAREVAQLPASKKVLVALSEMRRAGQHLAVVIDEYGGTDGIVTLEDLIEEVIGDIRDEYDVAEAESRRLRGGDVEVDGLLNLDEFGEATGLELPEGPYETAAGFVLARLGHVADLGEAVEVDGWRLTVTQLDGRRLSRLRVAAPPAGGEDTGRDEAASAGEHGPSVGMVTGLGDRLAPTDEVGHPPARGRAAQGSAAVGSTTAKSAAAVSGVEGAPARQRPRRLRRPLAPPGR